MHRVVLTIAVFVACVLHPGSARAFDPVEALGMTTAVSGTSGIDPQNPVISGSLSLRPRLKLSPNMSFGLRMDFDKEFTDDELNNEKHETIVSDLSFTLSHNKLMTVGDRVRVGGLARLYAPTSEASRLTGLRTAARVGGQVVIDLAPVEFTSRAYAHKYFREFTTAPIQDGGLGRNDNTGSPLSSWGVIWAWDLDIDLPGGIGLGLNWTLFNLHGYDNSKSTTVAEVGALGAPAGTLVGSHADADGLHQRFIQSASVALSYALAGGVNATASVSNGWMPTRRPNGRDYYNPILAYENFGNFTTVGFGLSYAL